MSFHSIDSTKLNDKLSTQFPAPSSFRQIDNLDHNPVFPMFPTPPS